MKIIAPTSPTLTQTRLYWLPLLVMTFVWVGTTIGFLYLGDLVYDDHDAYQPYKDTGFLASFDWSDLRNGTLQRWLNEGYAAAHGVLLILFCLTRGRDRLTILRRLFFVSVVSQILFQGQMMVTRLPDPNVHNVGRKWRYIHMPSQYVYGALLVQFYTGNVFLRSVSWLLSLGGIFILIPTHYLYTVDVETGLITGIAVFVWFHWHARTIHTICKTWALAWFELDFLRWHDHFAVGSVLESIQRDEQRQRSESLDTVRYIENLAIGKISLDDGQVTQTSAGAAERNDAIIAASLAPPLLEGRDRVDSSAAESEASGNSHSHRIAAQRHGGEEGGESLITLKNSLLQNNNTTGNNNGGTHQTNNTNSLRGSAYAAGGQDGFNRYGYSNTAPESDFLMEHFHAPPYSIDSATTDLTSILDAVEDEYYALPEGVVGTSSTTRGLGIVSRGSYFIDPKHVAMGGGGGGGGKGGGVSQTENANRNGGAEIGGVAAPQHSVEIHISPQSAAALSAAVANSASRPVSANALTTLVKSGGGGDYRSLANAPNNTSNNASGSGSGGDDEPAPEGILCCGIRVSSSSDPTVAAAERKNWIRRYMIIMAGVGASLTFGGGLAFLNEVPIHIADANRPIGIPLPYDVVHDYLPKVPEHTPDFLMYPLVVLGFGYLFLSRHRWVILRRTAVWYGICMGCRILTVPATFLPDPSPLCRLPEHPPGTTCGDLIYSGHTLTFAAALSVIWKYVDPLWVRAGAGAYAACGIMAIIMSRLHYTRDVFTALIVAFTVYHLTHRALVHRVDIYLNHKLLRYFEFDYFCLLVEDRQLAREGKVRRHLWLSGGVGETFAQIADAYRRRKERRARARMGLAAPSNEQQQQRQEA